MFRSPPIFLEKGSVWFEENQNKVLRARKTQQFFEDNIIYIEEGMQYGVSEFLRKLDELGYEKVLDIGNMGEFSHRGGLVEVFPINSTHAIRIEFIGNTIDTLENLPIHVENADKEKELLKKRLKSQKLFSDLKGLQEGNYLVHLDHGVARFAGFEDIKHAQYYVLQYAAGDKLFVPTGLERKLSRYVGFTDPKVSRLGSAVWQKTKRKAKEEIEKLAKQLLEVYAKREVSSRPAYGAADDIEEKLIQSFPYEETPDQIQTLEDIYGDLAKTEPMDRIVCGDVGFGKTEVALRTMIRAVQNGYQTAMLAPTTILAHQHLQNFQARAKGLPIRIETLFVVNHK